MRQITCQLELLLGWFQDVWSRVLFAYHVCSRSLNVCQLNRVFQHVCYSSSFHYVSTGQEGSAWSPPFAVNCMQDLIQWTEKNLVHSFYWRETRPSTKLPPFSKGFQEDSASPLFCLTFVSWRVFFLYKNRRYNIKCNNYHSNWLQLIALPLLLNYQCDAGSVHLRVVKSTSK